MARPAKPPKKPGRGADIRTVVGYNTYWARSRAGYVQARLAKLCGWDTTVISKVERGKQNLTLKRVQRLARALGTAEAALLRR